MNTTYIIANPPHSVVESANAENLTILLSEFSSERTDTAIPAVGDQVLLMATRNGEFENVSPFIYGVKKVDSKKLHLEQIASRSVPVTIERVRSIMNRSLSYGANRLQAKETEAIVQAMGPIRISEELLLDHIKRYIAARGYYFSDETIDNYHICLKTRPFVILAGLSGTGKSKLSQLYAEAIGHTVQNCRYLRLAVRPSWNDDRYLLGYLNTITGEYVSEPALDFVVDAEADRENLYFFCLDEMNLAHVEYYFSQFLSAMEEENPADRRILLYSASTARRLANISGDAPQDRVVLLPTNLLFTGTINMDETTQPISDKVIDRANTLEFFEVELDKVPAKQPPPDTLDVSAHMWRSYVAQQPDTSFRNQIIEIGKILNAANLGLGYRVLREIELYLANSHRLLESTDAFDLQVKQRILPRMRGTATLTPALNALAKFAQSEKLPRTAARVDEMASRLKRDGYTSFWR